MALIYVAADGASSKTASKNLHELEDGAWGEGGGGRGGWRGERELRNASIYQR
jgi:hypothetical protein